MNVGTKGVEATESPVVLQIGSGNNAQWEFIPKDGGYYQIKNRVSRKYIANFGSMENLAVLKQSANPGEGALWALVDAGNGSFKIQNKLSNMFMAKNGNGNESSPLVQKVSVGDGGHWKLNAVSGSSKGKDDGSIGGIPPDEGGGDGSAPPNDGGSTPPKDGGNTPPKDGGSTPPQDGGIGGGGQEVPNNLPKPNKGGGKP